MRPHHRRMGPLGPPCDAAPGMMHPVPNRGLWQKILTTSMQVDIRRPLLNRGLWQS